MNSPCSSKSPCLSYFTCAEQRTIQRSENRRVMWVSPPRASILQTIRAASELPSQGDRGRNKEDSFAKKTSPGIIFVFCGRGEGWHMPSICYVSCMPFHSIPRMWNPPSPLLLESFLRRIFSWSHTADDQAVIQPQGSCAP